MISHVEKIISNSVKKKPRAYMKKDRKKWNAFHLVIPNTIESINTLIQIPQII